MRFATADCETDPFRLGRHVRPFAWGFYDGEIYKQFWGDDCTEQFVAYLASLQEPFEIYAHNGGKFDWLFLMRYLSDDLQMIGSRIVKANLGLHQLRDSFANMPVPLRAIGNKLDINHAKLERRCREYHKPEISRYLKADCVELYKAVERYREQFGSKALTMASAAMRELRVTLKEQGLKLEKFSERQDEQFRAFYFGGRVQCFEAGMVKPNKGEQWNVYDVNSMYPAVMRDYLHPISHKCVRDDAISERTDFAIVEGEHDGCLPFRSATGGIDFKPASGIIYATGHEIRTALTLGKLHIKRVVEGYSFTERANFASFVNHFYDLRMQAKREGDDMNVLFMKLVLNSAYGKAALDPRKFTEMVILPPHVYPDGQLRTDPVLWAMRDGPEKERLVRQAWVRHTVAADYTVWSRHVQTRGRFINVAMAASITGAARSVLMLGLNKATRPVYCDTDSIICERLDMQCDETTLGAWKHEGSGDRLAIAGKKMYALFNDAAVSDGKAEQRAAMWGDPACVKLASKGVRLHAHEIASVADGNSYTRFTDAPSIGLAGQGKPLHRTLKRTA